VDKRAVLRRLSLFASFSDADCDAVLAVLKARRGVPGEVLFKEGDAGESMVIVLEGKLVARVNTLQGPQDIAEIGPGEVVGEMAFLDNAPRSASVAAPTGALVLEFSRAAFMSLWPTAPHVAGAILRNVIFDLTRRLREANSRTSLTPEAPRSQARPAPQAQSAATVDLLRRLPAFAASPEEELALLASIGKLEGFGTGRVLMQEGALGTSCWLIGQGQVQVSRGTPPTPLATLGPGALVGQLAMVDLAPRTATVSALSDVWALELGAAAFGSLMQSCIPFALRFQCQVAVTGAQQLRLETKSLAELEGRNSQLPGSMRMLDDWDAGPAMNIELAVDPRKRGKS
jgi:CRP-like cAMP-binding protein